MTVLDRMIVMTIEDRVESGAIARFDINPLTGSRNGIDSPDQMTPSLNPYVTTERSCEKCEQRFMYDENNDKVLALRTMVWGGVSWADKYYYVCSNCTDHCVSCDELRPAIEGRQYWINWRFIDGHCSDCSDDLHICHRCDEIIGEYDVEWVGDETYCSDCRERVASWCEECDQYEFHEYLCTSHDENIRNYGYKPQPIFFGTQDGTYLNFGIELEVEAKGGDLAEGSELMTYEWGEFTYLKEDSSLNFGFEIVTHPATLEYYQQEVKWSAINRLRDMGFRSWDTGTCGLHVHIDRRAFRDRTHLMAMTYLINNNSKLSQHIAGRNSDYGSIGNGCKHDNVRTIKSNWAQGYGGERYNAINLQNRSTVEIRMFKGSLKVERVLSGIEFCHAAVEYSRNIRSGIQAKDMFRPEEFISWIRKQGKYPNLVQFLPELEVVTSDNEVEMEN